jgi:hypothetical protein
VFDDVSSGMEKENFFLGFPYCARRKNNQIQVNLNGRKIIPTRNDFVILPSSLYFFFFFSGVKYSRRGSKREGGLKQFVLLSEANPSNGVRVIQPLFSSHLDGERDTTMPESRFEFFPSFISNEFTEGFSCVN